MSTQDTARATRDAKATAGKAATNVAGILGAMDVLFMELNLVDPKNQVTIDRLWALQEAAELYAKQVKDYFDEP